jgi:hypothetical protein
MPYLAVGGPTPSLYVIGVTADNRHRPWRVGSAWLAQEADGNFLEASTS